jgi:CRISPR/Cas system CMR-associated protein Cmr5 small subunit
MLSQAWFKCISQLQKFAKQITENFSKLCVTLDNKCMIIGNGYLKKTQFLSEIPLQNFNVEIKS